MTIFPFSSFLERSVEGFVAFVLPARCALRTRPVFGPLLHRRIEAVGVESLLALAANQQRILSQHQP